MQVKPDELEGMTEDNEAWHAGTGEHPLYFIPDDLFDRILADLQRLRAIEVGQGNIFSREETK